MEAAMRLQGRGEGSSLGTGPEMRCGMPSQEDAGLCGAGNAAVSVTV